MGDNLKKKIIFIILASIVIVSITTKITIDKQDREDREKAIRQSEQLILSQIEAAEVEIDDKKTISELKKDGVNLSTNSLKTYGCDLDKSYVSKDDKGTYNLNLDCGNYKSENAWKDWSDWTSTKPKSDKSDKSDKKIYQTMLLYNYALTTDEWGNWGKWSDWTTDEPITLSTETGKKETESKTVYKYVDTVYKFYKSNKEYADGYYTVATAPRGYVKDESTKIEGSWSDWTSEEPTNLDEVDVKIQHRCRNKLFAYYTGTARNKQYYKDSSGNIVYSATSIGGYHKDITKYTYSEWSDWTDSSCTGNISDDSSLIGSRRLYRYRANKYRFYKETKNYANGYFATAPEGYPVKDLESAKEGEWSKELTVKPEEQPNRKIVKTILYRFRTREKLSNNKPELPEYLEKEAFQKALGMSMDEIRKDDSIKILTKTQYRVKEAK